MIFGLKTHGPNSLGAEKIREYWAMSGRFIGYLILSCGGAEEGAL